MRRVLAVIGAVAMVALAVVIRDVLDDDGGDGGTSGDEEIVLVCDTGLAVPCAALDGVTVRVEDSATTADALVAGALEDVDGWVTTDAWYEVASGRAGTAAGEAEALGRAEVVAAVVPERAEALAALCGAAAVLRCLGDNAEQPWQELGGQATWGALRTGLPSADTATGLTVLGALATSFFDGTSFAANDFDPSGLRDWLGPFTAASAAGDPDALRTLVGRPGTYSAAVGLTPDLRAISRPLEGLVVAPQTAAVAVLVDLPGGDPLPSPDPLRSSLGEAGWVAASGPPAPRFKSGVLGALHDLWKEVVR